MHAGTALIRYKDRCYPETPGQWTFFWLPDMAVLSGAVCMSWFKNLSVQLKVLGIAGAAMLGFVGYLIWNFHMAELARGQLQRLQSSDFVALKQINADSVNVANLQEILEVARESKDANLFNSAQLQADNLKRDITTLASSTPPELQEDVAQLLPLYNKYESAALQFTQETINARNTADQIEEQRNAVVQLRGEFDSQLELIRSKVYSGFASKFREVQANSESGWQLALGIGLSIGILLLTYVVISRTILRPLDYAVDAANKIANGDWAISIAYPGRDELGRMLNAIQRMRDRLKSRFDQDRRAERIKTVVADLSTHMRGELTVEQLAEQVLNYLVPALNAQVGLFYLFRDDALHLVGSYAFTRRKNLSNKFALGESLVGQAALERKQIMLAGVPDDYIAISSGLGESVPRNILVTPILHEGNLRAVLEIGSLHSLDDTEMEIINLAIDHISVALNSVQSRAQLGEMLRQTQQQAELLRQQQETMQSINEDLEGQAIALSASEMKLQQQQEELRRANDELEQQARQLRASEESLQAQQEELRVINEELEAQAKLLADQRNELLEKNERLKESQEVLQEKTRQLEVSSKYKSEFLSTMSHELRTPLNSILILSNSLKDNKAGNLNEKQIEHARVINSAGSDLLALINDILDISKVEEGKMELVIESLALPDLADHLRRNFEHVAQHRGLQFGVELAPGLPPAIFTDRQRLEQVLRNFFSNAFKFTHQGSVRLVIKPAPADVRFNRIQPAQGPVIALSVVDTGIGVPKDKQQIIFEAFQQADGTTSRKYGGTGLGLTISREFSHLLGGEVHLFSDGEGTGSTFTLYLPVGSGAATPASAGNDPAPTHMAVQPVAPRLDVGTKTLLVIEDDDDFSNVLADLASEFHFRSLQAHDGERGLDMARQLRPDAIILDIGLPGMDGWQVLEHLKNDPATRDIPVHCFSGRDERARALSMGALTYYRKPATADQIKDAFSRIEERLARNVRRLLVVEDNSVQHSAIHEMFEAAQVDVTVCTTGQEALQLLRREPYDCMIVDLTLPDIDGYSLLENLHDDTSYPPPPVIVYTARDLTREQEAKLRKYADRIILKTDQSAERLLSEASLFLHWVDSNNASSKSRVSEVSGHRDDVFAGKKVLLVDDDMRNIYALSASLEEWGCEIELANNGVECLGILDANPDIDIVLMDIMMPEMDGYEAMQKIRAQDRFKKLPMLALTAKAMRDDRAKCIEAGANDYISKPVDIDKLQSLMRVWLQRP